MPVRCLQPIWTRYPHNRGRMGAWRVGLGARIAGSTPMGTPCWRGFVRGRDGFVDVRRIELAESVPAAG